MTTPLYFVAPDIYFCTVFYCPCSLSIIIETMGIRQTFQLFLQVDIAIESCKLVQAFPRSHFGK